MLTRPTPPATRPSARSPRPTSDRVVPRGYESGPLVRMAGAAAAAALRDRLSHRERRRRHRARALSPHEARCAARLVPPEAALLLGQSAARRHPRSADRRRNPAEAPRVFALWRGDDVRLL